MAQCKGKTQEGKRCKKKATDTGYCRVHGTQAPPAMIEEHPEGAADSNAGQGEAPGEPLPPAVATKEKEKEPQLYPVTQAIHELEDLIEEAEGLLTPEVEKALENLFAQFEHGAELLLRRAAEYELSAQGARAEVRRIEQLAREREARAAMFEEQILIGMKSRAIKKLELTTFTVLRMKSPQKVTYEDPGAIPEGLRTDLDIAPKGENETVEEYLDRLNLELKKRLTKPDKKKILEFFEKVVAVHEKKLEDEDYYIAMVEEHGRLSKEAMARLLANEQMPAGIAVTRGQHLRIK